MRIELIHPLIVHFPIALLSTGVVLRLIAIWAVKRPKLAFLLPASWTILILGMIAAWAAVIAGEFAQEIVGPSLPSPNVLDDHQKHAYMTAYSFTAGILIDLIRAFLLYKRQKSGSFIKKGLALAIWFCYLFGFSNLIITGYLGGELVYDEGAAVKVPAKNP